MDKGAHKQEVEDLRRLPDDCLPPLETFKLSDDPDFAQKLEDVLAKVVRTRETTRDASSKP